jgi:hypothetical protein
LAASLLTGQALEAARPGAEPARIRFGNERIFDVFRHGMRNSPAFEDLVATLEQLDRVVYIEEGRCQHQHITSCLQLMVTPGGRNIQIRVDPRQPMNLVVARVAHELYHASEIARDPLVVDSGSLRTLYGRIGYRNNACLHPPEDCWETRAAIVFERLVTEQLNGAS